MYLELSHMRLVFLPHKVRNDKEGGKVSGLTREGSMDFLEHGYVHSIAVQSFY